MYNEERKGLNVKDVIIKILIVVLFVFLLAWLFPMPNIKPLTDKIFNENIQIMKDAAKSYYTVDRLPKEVGQYNKLTLQQMLDNKMLLAFTDKSGKYCNTEHSYVEVTKMENEYILKVLLSCDDYTDYIIEHIGCYNLCPNNECTKPVEVVVTTPTNNPPIINQTSLKYYEYKKTINSGYWTAWDPEWTDVYKNEVVNQIRRQELIQYLGRYLEYAYEYSRIVNKTGTCHQEAFTDRVCEEVTKYKEEPIYEAKYGSWILTSSITQSSPCSSYTGETTKVVGSTNTEPICNARQGCIGVKTTYTCSYYSRSKTSVKVGTKQVPYKETECHDVTTYKTVCDPVVKTKETKYFTASEVEKLDKKEWTATGNTKVNKDITTPEWVTELPNGYTETSRRTLYKYQYYINTTTYETKWVTKEQAKLLSSDWVPTGQTKTETIKL